MELSEVGAPHKTMNFVVELEEVEDGFTGFFALFLQELVERALDVVLNRAHGAGCIEDDDEVLQLAYDAGAWYVYQAVYDTSDYIKERVKRYHDHGIGVEGTILLGLDNQTEDDIKRLIDFLGEIDLDLAEFTIFAPFPHTKGHDDLLRQGRIFDFDWDHYNAGQVVYQPKHMSPEKLQELYDYAWKSFYASETQESKMFRLFCNVALREMEDGTYRPRDRRLANKSFGRDVDRSKRNVNVRTESQKLIVRNEE